MKSIWLTENQEGFQTNWMGNPMRTDIVIIGTGMFGITTAHYLTEAGADVLVLDKSGIGRMTTGHTTAKITSQHGLLYQYLLEKYGVDFAKEYFEANEESIQEIEGIVQAYQIDCNFERQDHTMFTKSANEKRKIVEEVRAMKQFTSQVEKVTKTELPFEIELGITVKDQAQFHPIRYLRGLAKNILEKGNKIILDTTCYDLKKEKDGYRIQTQKGEVLAKKVVLASHYPFIKYPGLYFFKMYQSSSYVIAFDPKKDIFSGMYLQVEEPKFSFRSAIDSDGKRILILGGAGHKTGKSVTDQMTYEQLKQEVQQEFPEAEIRYWWSTRDCITLDKLPYIGQFSNLLPNVYIGTGFNKWGMTTSNLAARIVSDEILEKKNRHQHLFLATRMQPIENREEVKNILAQSVKSLVVQRVKPSQLRVEDLANGEGGIVQLQGKKVGVYRDENGKIYAVKPVCTHLGCLLNWNGADKTWDCPCHGSRYRFDGKNLYDPAMKDLETISVKEEKEQE